jgi:hypothetical protein
MKTEKATKSPATKRADLPAPEEGNRADRAPWSTPTVKSILESKATGNGIIHASDGFTLDS